MSQSRGTGYRDTEILKGRAEIQRLLPGQRGDAVGHGFEVMAMCRATRDSAGRRFEASCSCALPFYCYFVRLLPMGRRVDPADFLRCSLYGPCHLAWCSLLGQPSPGCPLMGPARA